MSKADEPEAPHHEALRGVHLYALDVVGWPLGADTVEEAVLHERGIYREVLGRLEALGMKQVLEPMEEDHPIVHLRVQTLHADNLVSEDGDTALPFLATFFLSDAAYVKRGERTVCLAPASYFDQAYGVTTRADAYVVLDALRALVDRFCEAYEAANGTPSPPQANENDDA